MAKKKRKDRKPKRVLRRGYYGVDFDEFIAACIRHYPEIARYVHFRKLVASVAEDGKFLAGFLLCTPHMRSAAMDKLVQRIRYFHEDDHECHLCPCTASTMTFIVRKDGLGGFPFLCDHCARRPRREMEAEFWRIQAEKGEDNHDGFNPQITGPRLGTERHLPPRPGQRQCRECGATMWIDEDELSILRPEDREPLFTCNDCAFKEKVRRLPSITEEF
jgi:hypothetical protein